MNELYLYLLAVISKRHGILVHGVTLMSTHEHLIVTDVRGCLPRFLAELHRMVALCVKCLRKWEGEVWDGGKTSVVELCTNQALIEKLAYVAANPVSAGLVERAEDWPGVTTVPADIGCAKWTARRPAYYLDVGNKCWPDAATLELCMPSTLRDTAEQTRATVTVELGRFEAEARERVRVRRCSFLGARKILRLSPLQRAKSWEPLRGLNPTFAVGRGQSAAFHVAMKTLRSFRKAYRDALESWRVGLRTAVFPRATWLMRVLHGATLSST